MDLQELISRGRFIFAGASERLRVYGLVDGRRTAKDLAIQGSDMTRQKLDQPLQNSIKNSVAPAAVVALKSVSVLGAVAVSLGFIFRIIASNPGVYH